MANFDEITSKIREGGIKAANTAKEAAGLAKMTVDIKAEELKMLDTYKEIGKLFCEKFDSEAEVDPEFLPLLKKIEDSKAKIAQIKEEKDRVKNGVVDADSEDVTAAEEIEAEVVEAVEEVAEEVKADVAEVAEEAAEAVVEEKDPRVDAIVAEATDFLTKARAEYAAEDAEVAEIEEETPVEEAD